MMSIVEFHYGETASGLPALLGLKMKPHTVLITCSPLEGRYTANGVSKVCKRRDSGVVKLRNVYPIDGKIVLQSAPGMTSVLLQEHTGVIERIVSLLGTDHRSSDMR